MPSMQEISRSFPDDDQQAQLLAELETDSDRGAALVCAAYLDKTLFNNIVARLPGNTKLHDQWFHLEGALFGTFSARIRAARALGVIGPKAEAELEIVRRIRNQFAHALLPLTFLHPTIKIECEKLHDYSGAHWPNVEQTRRRYMALCLVLSGALGEVARRDVEAWNTGALRMIGGLK